ncbi:MAG: prolipoprotein diacylglyceryl transferase [Lachnospiraceae bacterium]|nr:prolipoprotein diacylglyceryl transferase [Lachnospiraceae bacterium]
MNSTDIAFPNLGIYLENVPKNFTVFGVEIAFYGLIIAIGVMAGILIAAREAKLTGQNPENYWDLAIYAIIFSIVGARLYYVIFSWEYYKDDLMSIFRLREGGLAIYGAVIAAFLTVFVYTRIKKLRFWQMTDTAVLGLILGQIIGRWGNFMNREAFGDYSDGLFAMALPIDAVRRHEITANHWAHVTEGMNYIMVHPTFLYESAWNLGLLIFLLIYRRHKKFEGELTLMYLAGYGIGRFFIEGLRTDQLLLPVVGLPVSQILGLVLFIVGTITIVVVRICKKKEKSVFGESASLADNQKLGRDK